MIIGSSISYYLFHRSVNLCALIISRIITYRRANVRRGGIGISVRQHDAKLMSVPERGVDRPGRFNFDRTAQISARVAGIIPRVS